MAVYHLLEREGAKTKRTKVLTAVISTLCASNIRSKVLINRFTPPAPVAKLLIRREQNTVLVSGAVFCIRNWGGESDDVR